MKNFKLIMIIVACANIFAACKKDKTEPTELSKLPAATQTGANTFGCLVNGKAYVAQNDCKYLCNSPFKVSYNSDFGGIVGITGDWLNSKENIDKRIQILIDSTNHKLMHSISIYNPHQGAGYIDSKLTTCNQYDHYLDSASTHTGNVILTKYDLQNGIISGRFNFTLTKPGCETITVTDGRFDKKL